MTTENQPILQDETKRSRRFVVIFLAVAIIAVWIVPPLVAVKVTSEIEKMFVEFDAELPAITFILLAIFHVVVRFWYLFLLPIAVFIPLALWLFTKLSARTLVLLFVLSLVVQFIGAIVMALGLLMPLLTMISDLSG